MAQCLFLGGCYVEPVEPPDGDVLPMGAWVYVKGEAQMWCDGQDPYYSGLEGSALQAATTASDGYDVETIQDERLQGFGCEQDYTFYDAHNATSDKGPCGGKVWFRNSWLQLVSPRVLYLRRYYEVTNPYDIYEEDGSSMHCRIFDSGYLVPLDDIADGVVQ